MRSWCVRTAHRRYAAVSRFYAWARRSGPRQGDRLDGVELLRAIRLEPVVVSREQVNMLQTIAESLSCFWGGIRRHRTILDVLILHRWIDSRWVKSEAVNIRLSSVASASGELHVRSMKKGNKPKTYPLSGVVHDACTRWIDVRRPLDSNPRHRGFVFIDPRTGRHGSRPLVRDRCLRLPDANLRHYIPTSGRRTGGPSP